MKWSRREILRAGAGVIAGGAALEALSLAGMFDNRRLGHQDAQLAQTFAQRAFELDGLERGGLLHIGHSTHLLALGGLRVLTDPWFFDPAFGALSHGDRLPVTPQVIGALDLILITHDHPDHADRRALDRLDKNALVVVGVSTLAPVLRGLGFSRVEHVPLGQELTLGALRVTGVRALHDVPETGYVLALGDQSVYFAGDTATHADFAAIAERWDLSLAIVPIDGTKLRWESRLVMDASDAASATAILKPALVVSSHADATYADPIAEHVLSEHEAHPHATFKRLVQERAPNVTCVTPQPAQLVRLL